MILVTTSLAGASECPVLDRHIATRVSRHSHSSSQRDGTGGNAKPWCWQGGSDRDFQVGFCLGTPLEETFQVVLLQARQAELPEGSDS